jgi:carbamoyl-phosphate synthase small subunit
MICCGIISGPGLPILSTAEDYMARQAILVLEDGSVYQGHSFGAVGTAFGEVVFDTGMTGYQEMLTDPSFAGQLLVTTYPLIGNCGINDSDFESERVQVRGLAVREYCSQPSHWQSTRTLHEFLMASGIPGIGGLDTRALTRHLRTEGAMMGIVTSEMTVEDALRQLRSIPGYDVAPLVREVSTATTYEWQVSAPETQDSISIALKQGNNGEGAAKSSKIVVIDLGLKYSILRILARLGCRAIAVSCTASVEDIMSLNPDGIILSPGPGNPLLLEDITDTVKGLLDRRPMMGICLGHQLIGRALGAQTFKLKFGHRGSNHPVRDLGTGRVFITAQNHGYAIDADTVRGGLEVSHINLNDDTVEGLRHRDLPILSLQYHCEASPGPLDDMHLFTRFLQMARRPE